MMGAREINRSGNTLAVAVVALLAGCSTAMAVKSGKTGSSSAASKATGESLATAPGRPREVARAPLGSLSASKWQFDNGLTVVLMPDATATSVAYTTWYRVGSRD